MGTFMGHFLPGSFFLFFSIWWTVNILNRYYRARAGKSAPFRSSSTFPCCCGCLRRFQMEGFLKIVLTLIAITGEVITGVRAGHVALVGNGQHSTMFAFFCFSGVIDFLLHHGVPLPSKSDYVWNMLSFAVEGLLFMFHLHGRSSLDKAVHTLLVYVVWATIAAIALEMRQPDNVLCALARSFFVCLQGSWFIQVGAILYPPLPGMSHWAGEEHDQIMLTTIIFAWHMFFILLFMVVVACVMARVHRRVGPDTQYGRPEEQMRLTDSDDDVEMGRLEEAKLMNGVH